MPTYLVELEDGRKFRVESETPLSTEEATAYVLGQLQTQAAVPDTNQPSLIGSTSSLGSGLGLGAVTPTNANSRTAPEITEWKIIQVFDVIGPDAPISDVRTLAHAYMQSFDNGTSIEACFGINLLNGLSNAFLAPMKALSLAEGGSLHEGLERVMNFEKGLYKG